jgi:hypothetical protein
MEFKEPLSLGCNYDKERKCCVKHCHSCKREMDSSCICSECVCDARDGWLYHLHEHQEKNNYKPEECNMCDLILKGLKSK